MEANAPAENRLDQNKDMWGLALSGGGFRASFFHIGLLAALAENDMLRRIEVISTVSGGSIIGAMYYQRLKNLLETVPDKTVANEGEEYIEPGHYIEIIQNIEIDFCSAVEKNIRMRVFSNFFDNFRMSSPRFSRSDRISKLYDKYFYGNREVELCELKINPKHDNTDKFILSDHNTPRLAKVPILLLNATTLNTGHDWRFEAIRMGEPPYLKRREREIDKNMRLRRPENWDGLTNRQSDFRLSDAVASSACVPGLFHPMAISGMYPEVRFDGKKKKIRAQLVDGGVHDNLGVQGLLDRGCNRFIVSDASGQMTDDPDPSTNILKTLSRMNGILMDRVREEELYRLHELRMSGNLDFALMHLRKGLQSKTVAFLDEHDKQGKIDSAEKKASLNLTSTKQFRLKPSHDFGVNHEVQNRLSRIRTDLDSFTEIETHSLMCDGYLICKKVLEDVYKSYCNRVNKIPEWKFRQVEKLMLNPAKRDKSGKKDMKYLKHLDVASKLPFKVYCLNPWVAFPVLIFVTATIITGVGFLCKFLNNIEAVNLKITEMQNSVMSYSVSDLLSWNNLSWLAPILITIFIPRVARSVKWLSWARKPAEFFIHLITRGLIPALGSFFVWIHLTIFDKIFLNAGKLRKFDLD